MEQWTSPDCGTTRITNPKTLQRWLDNGNFEQLQKEGYVFNVGCGRFRIEKCICSACRKRPRQELLEVIEAYNDNKELSKNHSEEFYSELNK